MFEQNLRRVGMVALFATLPGCYAAAGPTIGVDLKTGRTVVGAEASAESFTVAESIALGSPRVELPPAAQSGNERLKHHSPAAPVWRRRTHLLWEPGVMSGVSDRSFAFGAVGGSIGLTVENYDDAAMSARFTAGAWLAAGHTLGASSSTQCSSDDVRPYALLVLGYRGGELYASPKLGILDLPHVCTGPWLLF